MIDILGLVPEEGAQADDSLVEGLMEAILNLRKEARERKDFAASDRIRDELAKINIRIKDTKDGATWEKFWVLSSKKSVLNLWEFAGICGLFFYRRFSLICAD